jgi:enoyl-[acyl-carrier-protein] reductase (NADH)
LLKGRRPDRRTANHHRRGCGEMALYLDSDETRMMTGQVLPVDSGVTIS